MKNRRIYQALLAVLVALAVTARGGEAGWQVLKSKHFLVYHKGDLEFARSVSRSAETYYRKIAHDLGFQRFDNFWLWDDRASIYIYPTAEAFRSEKAAPKWASGKANYERREISTFRGSPEFLDSVLPHELTHLIFRDNVGFAGKTPLWLDEGTAQWEEKTGREQAKLAARAYMKQGVFFPLSELTRMDIGKDTHSAIAQVFYTQARSLVDYLVEEHGRDRFRRFCGQLREGKSLDDALRFTYPDRMRNIQELEKKWKLYVEKNK